MIDPLKHSHYHIQYISQPEFCYHENTKKEDVVIGNLVTLTVNAKAASTNLYHAWKMVRFLITVCVLGVYYNCILIYLTTDNNSSTFTSLYHLQWYVVSQQSHSNCFLTDTLFTSFLVDCPSVLSHEYNQLEVHGYDTKCNTIIVTMV